MTPYLVHQTWVDLDCVQSIDSRVKGGTGAFGDGFLRGQATVAFHNGPMRIEVGQYTWVDKPDGSGGNWVGLEAAQAIWDQFIAAWKERASDRIDPMTGKPESFYRQYLLK